MKRAQLLHNPGAGEKDFSKEELTKIIENEGFDVTYSSVRKDGWDNFKDEIDFIIVAGGDGTVRQTAKALVNRKVLDKQFPIALLPHGTANNVATTLNISGEVTDIVRSWHKFKLKEFDIGKVLGLKEEVFFLEGFGFGVFPKLMKVMQKLEDELSDDRDEKIKTAREVLHDVVLAYEPRQCKVIADDVDYSGKYILVEIMNTTSIGPNLGLSGSGDPGDGVFELVLVSEDNQRKFEKFLLNRISGQEDNYSFSKITAKKIQISWEGKDVHADDELLKIDKKSEVSVEIMPGVFEFMIPE
ncbi:diacylglycerol kinase [Dyadobacter sp. CY345]|uniref:diacylglycerol/lipid kinase family protein n=1 Tax=Dyadobacter sp. CY345 TaxID=2909335 RepID=UPI001F47BF68|nr:diacylglycerol kinase family protein [Dyadobacter sp. CY345]MCF2443829.1 diacylglycerol kinase [Dyadobacter sp. CY345]